MFNYSKVIEDINKEANEAVSFIGDAFTTATGGRETLTKEEQDLKLTYDSASFLVIDALGKAVNASNEALTFAQDQLLNVTALNTQLVDDLKGASETKISLEGQVQSLNATKIDLDGQVQSLNATKIDLDGQVQSLNTTKIDLDGQVKSLNETKIDLDGQVKSLNTTKIDLDGQVKSLNTTKIDLDGQVKSLNTTKIDLDGQVKSLNTTKIDLEEQVKNLNTTKIDLDGQVKGVNTTKIGLEASAKNQSEALEKYVHKVNIYSNSTIFSDMNLILNTKSLVLQNNHAASANSKIKSYFEAFSLAVNLGYKDLICKTITKANYKSTEQEKGFANTPNPDHKAYDLVGIVNKNVDELCGTEA